MDIINTTKNIQWSKVAFDIQVMMNETIVKTGAFVSEKVWGNNFFQATFISVLFLTAYWSIIYLDSSQPGVNPPSPFSSIQRKKSHYQRQAHFHMNYLLGAIISVLLFLSIFFNIF
ncbi:CLUMA_CG017809, isoform A [Clunio marinus]|uniref:CLUMA_CG017809, isoform A n=1 Tax=Clunio marinus TaxID=568069 RepID=A0A1J1IX19_9DIPT|nr:CLUMA_CG017809, isoform A [Clunio marinus]